MTSGSPASLDLVESVAMKAIINCVLGAGVVLGSFLTTTGCTVPAKVSSNKHQRASKGCVGCVFLEVQFISVEESDLEVLGFNWPPGGDNRDRR